MDKKELIIQIAVGSLSSPTAIADVIKQTADKEILHWAARHKSTVVRKAAARNKYLSDIDFMYLSIFEDKLTVRDALKESINRDRENRQKSLKKTFALLEDYPQLKIDFCGWDGLAEDEDEDEDTCIEIPRRID